MIRQRRDDVMGIAELIKKYRHVVTILLGLAGIGTMAYYDYCDTACSYLVGDVLGIDLKWVGIAYMSVVIVLAVFRQTPWVRILLAGGLGVEVHLYAFQWQNDVYCPFCLAFSALLILSFLVNYEVPSAWRERPSRMWLYFLGEVSVPMLKIKQFPLLLVSVAGYLFILLTFSGSVTPVYGQDSARVIPSMGQGPYEVTIFSSYFCPPCRRIDKQAEPLLKELVSSNRVKLMFIDVPFTRIMPVYAKYYLYAANADAGPENIFHVREVLFEAAQNRRIEKEDVLLSFLGQKKIALKPMDEKAVFPLLSAHIKANRIDQTPIAVIRYSPKDQRRLVGTDEIWDGLNQLKAHLAAEKK